MSALRASSLSVMVGSRACNLACPFCISKTTYRPRPVAGGLSRARIAFLADKFLCICSGLPYGIITGKGEPTLAPPEELDGVIETLHQRGLIPELQTNGVLASRDRLAHWQGRGLNTLALSCVSHNDELNSRMLSGGRVAWRLGEVAAAAARLGLLVRVTVCLVAGGIDEQARFDAFMTWAGEHGVHQVTFRRLGEPRSALPGSARVRQWIRRHRIEPDFILTALESAGRPQAHLPWGRLFTYRGISVMVTDHMNPPSGTLLRHAVIQPDGHLYGSWDDLGDVLV